jgi:nicotinamide riboside transporter PnuC
MLDAIKGLFGSKKFWLTMIGGAVISGMTYAHVSAELIAMVAGLFGLNAVGQGLADFGKNAPK